MDPEILIFANAVPVWGDAGSRTRFHAVADCPDSLGDGPRRFTKRYEIAVDDLCPTCGHAVIGTDGISSNKLARLFQLQARLRSLSGELLSDGANHELVADGRMALVELNRLESVVPRAHDLRAELVEEAMLLLDTAGDTAALAVAR